MKIRLATYSKIFVVYLLLVKFYFKIKILFSNKSIFFIIDIDNTVADTWPTIGSSKDEFLRYENLPVFDGFINFLKVEMRKKEAFFLFLSARNPIYYNVTKKWLSKQGFYCSNLILVPKAVDKLIIIKSIPTTNKVLIYDDLSYNHENGQVKFYSEIISELKSMKNVNYFDYEFLKKYQI